MKRLFYLVLVITLPLIAWFQYQSYRRFHPPADYSWEIKTGIDTNYHDPEVLLRYYQYAAETESYARWAWAEHRIDLRTPDRDDPETQQITQRYQRYQAVLRHMEQKLVQSARIKAQGHDNGYVKRVEQGLASIPDSSDQAAISLPPPFILARRGDQGSLVSEVQEALSELGYSLRIDGIFDDETEKTLRAFQRDQGLTPTGQLDLNGLTLLKNQ